MGKIYVVGIGPGNIEMMTAQARDVLGRCDVIIGYKTYIELIRDYFPEKEYYSNGMRGELKRCEVCLQYAKEGRDVALICSGDAGVYGMASPMLEAAQRDGFDNVEIIPGVSAAMSGAALLGAPLSHDFCLISLSDLLTPKELIAKRLLAAAQGDFCISIYNPVSKSRPDHLRWACRILLEVLPEDTACGYVRNIGRSGTEIKTCTLKELPEEPLDMFSTVFIGNSKTRISGGRMITPRGYQV